MAFSSSSLLRLINAKGIIGSSSNYCMLGKWSARYRSSLFNLRGLSTATMPNQDSSPWLMLPPEIEAGTVSYKFYSVADNKVQTLCPIDKIRNLQLTCRGSSHGWLALLRPHHHEGGFYLRNPITGRYLHNPISGRLIKVPSILNLPTLFKDSFFLYNPISGRLIKLPSILNLATFFKDDMFGNLGSPRSITKVILSCSPDEDEDNCRAVIVRNSGYAMAFCCPGRSKEWTLMLDEDRDYKDCVYSARLKLFFTLNSNYYEPRIETWDLRDLSSPKLIKVDETNIKQGHFYSLFHTFVPLRCGTKEHLVVAKEDLLLVVQYIMEDVGPDGSCFEDSDDSYPGNCHHMTIGFDIFKYDDSEKGKFEYLDSSSLGDLAIFVGSHNHSVAIQATEFPGVKPNSIYFTDAYGTGNFQGLESYYNSQICGHDIGIYNYQDKTVSPCYYPCDASSVKPILPAPIWFYPSRTI
ncbi:hypothetical protein CASFOL_026527 [Castilleja foliolosa]|uniref:KIB1-4 beta-propeller domain-containing protein n=1 Tax=Castilleja foliolosa TaxID=1961234 RepID=A0ABD3CKM7_9LAMI